MHVKLVQLWMVLQMTMLVTGEESPYMQHLRRHQLLQNRKADPLRRTRLNNRRNRIHALPGIARRRFFIPPLSITKRTRYNRKRNKQPPAMITNVDAYGKIPFDSLLRQQRNHQSKIPKQLRKGRIQKFQIIDVNVGTREIPSHVFNRPRSSVRGKPSLHNVPGIVKNKFSNARKSRNHPNKQNTVSTSSSARFIRFGSSNNTVPMTQKSRSMFSKGPETRTGTGSGISAGKAAFTPRANVKRTSRHRSIASRIPQHLMNSRSRRFPTVDANVNTRETHRKVYKRPRKPGRGIPSLHKVRGILTKSISKARNDRNRPNTRNTVSSSSSSRYIKFSLSRANNVPKTQKSRSMLSRGSGLSTDKVALTAITNVKSTPMQRPSALACTREFRQMRGHTLCMTDSPRVTRNGVAIDDAMMITQLHNRLRGQVQPPAADLLKLQWDDRLAAVAEKWAKQCILAHDKQRSIPAIGIFIGQNVGVGYETWQEAIQDWYDEIHLYRYGLYPESYLGSGRRKQITHFTQIVHNGTYSVGCGFAECPSARYVRYYVCNYAAGQSSIMYPYTIGSRCGSCPTRCYNGLCDCGGLVCQNSGKLNLSTCTCKCRKPFKGSKCESVHCPLNGDHKLCRFLPQYYCRLPSNVPGKCPYKCGICNGSSPTVRSARHMALSRHSSVANG